MAVNTKAYLEAYLKIRGKDGRLLPLRLNGPQQKLYAALAAQYKLAPLRIATNMGTFPQTIKEALVMQGLPVGKCLDPIQELSPAQKETLRGVLQQMELI